MDDSIFNSLMLDFNSLTLDELQDIQKIIQYRIDEKMSEERNEVAETIRQTLRCISGLIEMYNIDIDFGLDDSLDGCDVIDNIRINGMYIN